MARAATSARLRPFIHEAEFGKKLIEQFFPKIDLTMSLTRREATSRHGTPTVIYLVAIVRRKRHCPSRVGHQGEPSTRRCIPRQVWQSIVQQIDRQFSG